MSPSTARQRRSPATAARCGSTRPTSTPTSNLLRRSTSSTSRGLEYQAYTNPNPDAQLRLAEVYQRNHLYDSALNAVARGLKMSPRDPRLLALRARLLSHPPALASSH